MADPFLGEIKIVGFNYAPRNWAECNGQFLPINQNQALFSLFGTMYGGNGQTTFALPDFRGRVPIHIGNGFVQGQASGQETHTVTQQEMPAHTHLPQATSSQSTTNLPTGNLLASINAPQYNAVTQQTTLGPSTVTNVGGSQPHENRQPYLVLNFIVCLIGIFPSQN